MVDVPKVRENGRQSSSPGLSSPPTPSSPTHAKSATQTPFVTHSSLHPQNGPHDAKHGAGEKVGEEAKNVLAPVKKPRKKREPNNATKKQTDAKNGTASSNVAVDGKDAPVKQRKPRSDRGTSTRGRKARNPVTTHADVAASGRSKITDTLAPSLPSASPQPPATIHIPQNGNHEAIPVPQDSKYIPQYLARDPTPRSSGQNYDPIRSSTVDPRSIPPTPSNRNIRSPTPPRPANYATASNSPSISSLIEPPAQIHYPHLKRDSDVNIASSPPKRARMTPPEAGSLSIQQVPDPTHRPSIISTTPALTNDAPTPMDVDDAAPAPSKPPTVARKSTTSTGTSTPAATKASRQREAPVASGNGLLSSALFGGPSENIGPEKTAPTVILDIPLHGENNKYINFARLAEERYGFNALHPRLAAQRERLARVAAAGAALENAEKRANGSGMSADDMSVDLSEGEAAADDSNVEMGGISLIERDVLGSGRSPGDGSEGPAKRKKRVMKEDQYDKDDPFVDDTELAWEEQAAASKDGFFVYSGPLVPEGEKPNVERYVLYSFGSSYPALQASIHTYDKLISPIYRADGPPKRGRGGGRARGSARGPRGGAIRATPGTRKPRVTKAAREQMDKEKLQRESMAPLAAKPTSYPTA
jgi:hypothetical protein